MGLPQHFSEIRDPVVSTFKWVLARPDFTSILEGNLPRILHILGKPRIRKSVLSKLIYHKLDAASGPRPTYSVQAALFFACNAQVAGRRTDVNVLSSVIAQILEYHEANRSLPCGLGKDLEDLSSAHHLNFGHLRTFFLALLHHSRQTLSGSHRIVLVLDGLDECDEVQHRGNVLDVLQHAVENSGNGHFLFGLVLASRPYTDISLRCCDVMPDILDLNDESALDKDLAHYIKWGVDRLIKERPPFEHVRQEMMDKLRSRAEKMFLLVKLLLDLISTTQDSSAAAIRKVLESLPTSLSEIYRRTWARIDDDTQAKMIFSWLLCTVRPLAMMELSVAIATCTQHTAWNDQRRKTTKGRIGMSEPKSTSHGNRWQPLSNSNLLRIDPYIPMDLEGDLKRMFGPLIHIHGPGIKNDDDFMPLDDGRPPASVGPKTREAQDKALDSDSGSGSGSGLGSDWNNGSSAASNAAGSSDAPGQHEGDAFREWKHDLTMNDANIELLRRRMEHRIPNNFSIRGMEPSVSLCHQTVKEHFTKDPSFLNMPQVICKSQNSVLVFRMGLLREIAIPRLSTLKNTSNLSS
jgi:hypothetical protein